MGRTRTFFLPVAVVFLLALINSHAWAGGKLAVVQYALKAIESVDSGRYIKTEWNAKIRNRASEPVSFTVTIVFVDSNNDVLKEASSPCELQAQQTKSFSDTVLLEASIASRIATTRVRLNEATGDDAAP